MPLPPALAARLAKRGLIAAEEPQKKVAKNEVEEEVFAEDYDDEGTGHTQGDSEESEVQHSQESTSEKQEDSSDDGVLISEVSACPNKSNPYHECVEFCMKNWGLKMFQPDAVDERRRKRMLRKYPLPDGWCEVGDPSTGRCYYWNQVTDQVTWLAPMHPRAVLTFSSKQLSDVAASYGGDMEQGDEPAEDDDEQMDMDEDIADKDFEEIEREVMQERKQRDKGRDRGRDREESDRDRRKGRNRRDRDELDPMDPASYSDIPRGTWATGLETRGSAKTGADATASGPLFQQRPYPSPGAVLRANKELNESDSE